MRILSLVASFLFVFGALVMPSTANADFSVGISISASFAPPALPVYVQPAPPSAEYIWSPGFWAYDADFGDYYWVPGTWVRAPQPGYLWTPGYWHWREGSYVFSDGYWGPHIGFYGGINYGHGYGGSGFSGGSWDHGRFVNRTVNETNITINNTTNNYSSVNGGPNGVKATPTAEEKAAMSEKHIPATSQQTKHMNLAKKNPALRASACHGKPAIAATAKPGVFKGPGVVKAKSVGAPYKMPKSLKAKAAAAKAVRTSKTSRSAKAAAATKHGAVQHSKAAAHVVHHKPAPVVKKIKPKVTPAKEEPKTNGNGGNL